MPHPGHQDRPRYRTRFGSWVSRTTVPLICQNLSTDPETRVKPEAVYQWLAGVTEPRPHRALALVAMSKGEISLDVIYAHRSELRSLQAAQEASGA